MELKWANHNPLHPPQENPQQTQTKLQNSTNKTKTKHTEENKQNKTKPHENQQNENQCFPGL